MSSTVLERIQVPPSQARLPKRESVSQVEVSNSVCADNSHDRQRQSPTRDGSALAVGEIVLAFLRGWRERRRARGQLAAMSDRELQDVGICRSDIAFEVSKPFWRA